MTYKKVIIKKFGGPEVLEVIEEEQLPEPLPGEVRVRVLATSASFTDTMVRKGIYPGVKKKPPFAPGYDMVGVVDKIGEDVRELSVGEQVADLTVTGAYSEYLTLPASRLVPVPQDLDPASAVSMILSYLTAYQMLHRSAAVREGQRILVHGAGGAVGTALLQLGRLSNLIMWGTASQPKHSLVSDLGAVPIDYRAEDFLDRIRREVSGGVDAVFDPIGGDHFKRSFQTLSPGGILVAFGFYNQSTGKGGSIPLDYLRLQMWNLLPNGKSTTLYSIASWREKHPDWFANDLGQLFQYTVEGKINPIIWKRMPLTEAAKAHALIEDAQPEGKIILDVHPGG